MDIQLNQIIFQIINFGIVFAVLVKFLFKPVQNILEQRAQKIEEGLKAAEQNVKAQNEIQAKKEEVLQKARKEASEIKKEAKSKAEKEAAEIISSAKKEAKKILDKEREALVASIESERKSMQNSIAQLVTETTQALLKRYLSDKEQQQIIEKQIQDLKNIKLA